VLGALIAMGETATARPASRQALARRPEVKKSSTPTSGLTCFVTDIDQNGEPVVALAHEALISGWRACKAGCGRRGLSARKGPPRPRRTTLARANRDRDYLLVEGKPLAEAEDALKKRPGELEPDEIQFVEVSSTSAARQRRVRRLKRGDADAGPFAHFRLHCAAAGPTEARRTGDRESDDSALAADELQKSNVRVALAYLADALRNNPGNEKATALAVSVYAIARCRYSASTIKTKCTTWSSAPMVAGS